MEEDNPEVIINNEEQNEWIYNFSKSKLYSFKWSMFQYVEPDSTLYNYGYTKTFCKLLRLLVVVLLWCALGFEVYTIYLGCKRLLLHASELNMVMIVLHRLIWLFRYVCIQHIGVYMFHKHPYKIEEEISEIYALYEDDEKEEVFIKIKVCERKCETVALLYVFFVVLLPICQNTITLIIVRKYNFILMCDKDSFIKESLVNCIYPFIITISRITSLPFFINLIFLSYLQRERIKSFIAKLEFQPEHQNLITESYVKLHNSIRKVSSDLHLYVACLLIPLILWGAIGAYSVIEFLLELKMSDLPDYPIVISDLAGSSLIFLFETLFLFFVLLLTLGKVAYNQKMIVPSILMLPCPEKERQLFTIANRVEKLQLTHFVGYTLFRVSLTELNTVWLTVLGPIIALLFKFLLTEHLQA